MSCTSIRDVFNDAHLRTPEDLELRSARGPSRAQKIDLRIPHECGHADPWTQSGGMGKRARARARSRC